MPKRPKTPKLSPLAAALVRYREAWMREVPKPTSAEDQVAWANAFEVELARDFQLTKDELRRLSILASFGRIDEFHRDRDPRYQGARS